jgi:hypothetical protein
MDEKSGAAGAVRLHARENARDVATPEVEGADEPHTDEAFRSGDAHAERRERAVAATKLALTEQLRGRVRAFADAAGVSSNLVRMALDPREPTRRLAIDKVVAVADEDRDLALEVWHGVRRLIERTAGPDAVTGGDVAHELRRVTSAVGVLADLADRALSDDRIDNRERASLKVAIRQMRAKLDRLEQAVEGGAR